MKKTKISGKKQLFGMIFLFFYLAVLLFLSVWLLIRYAGGHSQKSRILFTTECMRERMEKGVGTEREWKEEKEKTKEGEEAMEKGETTEKRTPAFQGIRVCIRSDNYESEWHDTISILSDAPWTLLKATASKESGADTVQVMEKESVFSISAAELPCGAHLIAIPSEGKAFRFPALKRAADELSYYGKLHLYRQKEGILLVNEVELETYLKSVVAGEMPSSFPLEAQKAQAVCARTYAVRTMEAQKNKNSFADLDDSTAFQVYNNQQASASSTQAVDATSGEILSLASVQYYSTAYIPGVEIERNLSGKRNPNLKEENFQSKNASNLNLSVEETFAASLEEAPDEKAEYGSPWLRWNTVISSAAILEQLKQRSGEVLSSLDAIEVGERTSSGQVSRLLLCGDGRKVSVDGEYEIRAVLSVRDATIILQSGQEITGLSLLPSAWMRITQYDSKSGRLSFVGGGYGHGNGMSQWGAAAMAADGANYLEILDYYYGESELEHVKNL